MNTKIKNERKNKKYHADGTVPRFNRKKKTYHTVGTVPRFNRKKKHTTLLEQFQDSIERKNIPHCWNSSKIQ
jgi:hypothetical protein